MATRLVHTAASRGALAVVALAVGQVEGRPEDEGEASDRIQRRWLLMIGEELQAGQTERGDTPCEGKRPAQDLAECDLPLHVASTVPARCALCVETDQAASSTASARASVARRLRATAMARS